jgi:SAM-dependent methyltransferase
MNSIDDRRVVLERERAIAESKFHHANRTIIAEVVKSIRNGQGQILEIGCGHGDVTRDYLAPNCARVIATDVVDRGFGVERAPANVSFRLEDALSLSFPDETFDGVFSVDVIEHVPDDGRFVEEGLRVLKKGGTLFFTTPNRLRVTALARYLIGKPLRFPHVYATDPVLGDITHLREYSLTDLRRLLAGFKVSWVEIKGVWFGVPALQIGIARPGPCLWRHAFIWHVRIVK